jgi:AcrR family transcriptional regulator
MTNGGTSPAGSLRVDQVVVAVRTLFRRYGYRRTSVDDIAREAGISKATLYLHFRTKEDMFRAMARQFREAILERCRAAEALAAPVEDRLVALLDAGYGTGLEWFGDAAHIRELNALAADQPISVLADDREAFRRRLERMLNDAASKDELDLSASKTDGTQVARVLLFAAHGAKEAQRDGTEGYRDALEEIVRIVTRGFRR